MLQIAGSVSYIAQLNQCYVMNYAQLSQYWLCIRSIPLGWKHCAIQRNVQDCSCQLSFSPSVEGTVIIMQAFGCKMHISHSILCVYIIFSLQRSTRSKNVLDSWGINWMIIFLEGHSIESLWHMEFNWTAKVCRKHISVVMVDWHQLGDNWETTGQHMGNWTGFWHA